MPTEDINTRPFDEATLTKLDIFEQYLEAWLPVFIQSSYNKILVCDFFAGSGTDSKGCPGSPLRILRTVEKFWEQIVRTKTGIRIIFNDNATDKTDCLKSLMQAKIKDYDQRFKSLVSIDCENDEFHELFHEREEDFHKQPNLLFLDQYGVNEVTGIIFQKLISLERTDFLFFISSSYIRRFAGEATFRALFTDLDPNELLNARYEDIHRIILWYYRKKIPSDNPMRLYPFTIKKGPNIYGLIFGSKHPLGAEKFLNIAWEINKLNGEANFDIDGDIGKCQPDLFPDSMPQTKLKQFECNIEEMIKRKKNITNLDLFYYALENGHTPKQALDIVLKLKQSKVVDFEGRMGCSYNTCIRRNNIKNIKAVGK